MTVLINNSLIDPNIGSGNTAVLDNPGWLEDSLIIAEVTLDSDSVTITTPDGDWTEIDNLEAAASGGPTTYWYQRVMTGSEPSSWDFGLSGSTRWTATGIPHTGQAASSPIEDHEIDDGSGGTTLTSPSATSSGAARSVLRLVSANGNMTFTPPAGFTALYDQQGWIGQIRAAGAFEPAVGSGAMGTADFTASSTLSGWTSAVFVVKPEAVPSGVALYSLHSQLISAPSGALNQDSALIFPPSGCLLVVIVGVVGNNVDDDITIGGGGLTWTKRAQIAGGSGSFATDCSIWTAPVATGASMAVNISSSGGSGARINLHVFAVLDYDSVGTKGEDTFTGNGAKTLTLDAAPESDSIVLAARYWVPPGGGVQTATPATGWTELYDIGISGWGSLQSQWREGSTSDEVDWDDVDDAGTGNPYNNGMLVAVEIKAATGGNPYYAYAQQ